jgi:hypothetical protein
LGGLRPINRKPRWGFHSSKWLAANILNSPRAVAMSVYVIRAFIKIREDIAANAAILRRLVEIDKTLLLHDFYLCGGSQSGIS